MGTEEFWVPAVLAAVSAGGQYVNQKQATTRQNNAETQAIINQQGLRDQANAQVRGLTQQIAKDDPQQIAAASTGQYVDQLRRNAAGSTQGGSTTGGTQTFGGSTSSLPPNSVAGANARYGADLASGQKQVQDFGDTYAKEMGQLDAATRLRQNEGLAMQTEGTNLNTLGMESYGQNFVDQLRAQAAGQPNPWLTLGSNLLGGAATQISTNPNAYFGSGNSAYAKINSKGYNPKTGLPVDAGNGLGDYFGSLA